jgi:hypothetical protein
VVRLGKAVTPLPGSSPVELPRTYILPGERLQLDLSLSSLAQVSSVRIFPATTYGFAVDDHIAPVTR